MPLGILRVQIERDSYLDFDSRATALKIPLARHALCLSRYVSSFVSPTRHVSFVNWAYRQNCRTKENVEAKRRSGPGGNEDSGEDSLLYPLSFVVENAIDLRSSPFVVVPLPIYLRSKLEYRSIYDSYWLEFEINDSLNKIRKYKIRTLTRSITYTILYVQKYEGKECCTEEVCSTSIQWVHGK